MTISFGDNVRVLSTPETEALGLAGKNGQVYGETTPSVTNIEVIGNSENDIAINVNFEESEIDHWFSPSLLELIDHAPGTEIVVGNMRAVRNKDGTWEETKIGKKWWQFWKS